MLILGIETSCDETAAAVVEDGKKILSNIISSQIEIHREYGGVVPEIASRHHIKNITNIIEEALITSGKKLEEIDYIAVTYAPGLIGALLVGISVAKGMSYSSKIPLVPVHHLKGHIYSNFIEHDIWLPAVCLIVSGGHTNIVYMKEDHTFEAMGQTLDDAVGESYDKIARVMGIGYPGGPVIDKLSKTGNSKFLKIPKPQVEGEFDFSFSGIKTSVINYINKSRMKNEEFKVEDLAASFQTGVVEMLVDKTVKAAEKKQVKSIIIAGGVAANSLLREEMEKAAAQKGIKVYYPAMKYCTDNGAMVGVAAYYKLKYGKNPIADLRLNGKASMEIEED